MRLRFGLLVPLLAAVSSSVVSSSAVSSSAAAADAAVVPVKGFLCSSAPYAIRFADARAQGQSEEMAQDQVGRVAKAEVCGFYVGLAVVETEHVQLAGGTAYKLTAFRFKTDHRVAWLAERTFAPATATNWDL